MTLDRRAGHRIGSICLARHGLPDVDRNQRLTAEEYVHWWADYDRADLKPGQVPPQALLDVAREADVVFASTLPRARATAAAVAGGKDVIVDPVFVEAPLPPPPLPCKFSARMWGVWARTAWWFGRADGGESREEAEVRAQAAAATLTARALRGENVLLCAHGWFNRMMRPVLKSQGWVCVHDGGDTYWSHRRYEKKS